MRAVAHAAGQPYRRVAAPSLATSSDLLICARRQDGITECLRRTFKGTRWSRFLRRWTTGLSDENLFGVSRTSIRRPLNVRSGQTACWFSHAGVGVAIVDAAAVAGSAFAELALRPYRCDAKLEIFLPRRRDRPLSRPAQIFCKLFRQTWKRLSADHHPYHAGS